MFFDFKICCYNMFAFEAFLLCLKRDYILNIVDMYCIDHIHFNFINLRSYNNC